MIPMGHPVIYTSLTDATQSRTGDDLAIVMNDRIGRCAKDIILVVFDAIPSIKIPTLLLDEHPAPFCEALIYQGPKVKIQLRRNYNAFHNSP